MGSRNSGMRGCLQQFLCAVPAARDQHACAGEDQHDTEDLRNFIVVLCGYSDVKVSYAGAVMLGMGQRNEKRKHSQNQYYQPDSKQRFHKPSP